MNSICKLTGVAMLVVLAAAVSSANAADLPMKAYTQAPVVAPVYNWTGIYVGINGGYGFGRQTPLSMYSGNFVGFDYSADGWLGGVTMGAQIQSGHVVLGLEGDLDWTNSKGSGTGLITLLNVPVGTATLSSTVSSISTMRVRIGYAVDNLMVYGTGGVAVTNEKSTIVTSTFACNAPGNLPCSSRSDLHLGMAAGAGIEYGITPNLSAKAEYIWVGAGAINTLKENIIKGGINYRFGGI